MLSETVLAYASNPYVLAGLCLVIAYWASTRLQPVLILLSHKKNLMDEPEDRSSHTFSVPTYGGVPIFITFSIMVLGLATFLDVSHESLEQTCAVLAGITILFFLGVKDDMVGLDPAKKFIGQLLAATVVVFLADVRIESMEGIFGVGELPYAVSVVFTIFVFMLMVNAYNLIDGIDGLAGMTAIIASLVFGAYFLVVGDLSMATMSFVLVGALIGFLRFNLSDSKKIFMGDSGSLFIGFLLAFQAVQFLSSNLGQQPGPVLSNAPVIVLTVLSFPLMDTLRSFVIRAARGRSPFAPDRNHIHHRLLQMGMSHKQATGLISLKVILLTAVCCASRIGCT